MRRWFVAAVTAGAVLWTAGQAVAQSSDSGPSGPPPMHGPGGPEMGGPGMSGGGPGGMSPHGPWMGHPGFGGGPGMGPGMGTGMHPPPRPPRSAVFNFARGDMRITIKCSEEEPTRVCVEAATTLMDKLSSLAGAQH